MALSEALNEHKLSAIKPLSKFHQNSMISNSFPSPSIDMSSRETMISFEKEDENTIFARFFLLCEKDKVKEDQNQKEEVEILRRPESEISCFYRYLCCCLIKEEEDYYSHF